MHCYKPINCKFICLTVYLTASSSGVFNLSLSKLGDCGWEEKAINWLEARAALALRLLLPFVRLEGLEGCSRGLVVELNWDSMESSSKFLLLSSKEDLLLAVSTIFFSLKVGWLDYCSPSSRPQRTLTFWVNDTFLNSYQQNPMSNDLTNTKPRPFYELTIRVTW